MGWVVETEGSWEQMGRDQVMQSVECLGAKIEPNLAGSGGR